VTPGAENVVPLAVEVGLVHPVPETELNVHRPHHGGGDVAERDRATGREAGRARGEAHRLVHELAVEGELVKPV
jgi:hypothetical protein